MNNKGFLEKSMPYIMIAPAMIGIILFVIYPIIYLVYLSLFDYNLMNKAKSTFIGAENYVQLFSRDDFFKAMGNTMYYTAGVVIFTLIIALLVALWLKGNSKFNVFIQAGIFTPHIISIVSISLVWLLLMEPNVGLLNYVLDSVGLPKSQWLQSSDTAMNSIILISVWQNIGYYALIIIAALQSVSPQIYEAAKLDHASRFTTLRKLTLPLISPQLFFILIVMTIGSFKVFDTVRIMTGGGPNNATTTLVYYIYNFRTTNIGYASATGIVLVLIISILTILYFRVLSKKIHYQ